MRPLAHATDADPSTTVRVHACVQFGPWTATTLWAAVTAVGSLGRGGPRSAGLDPLRP